MKDLYWKALERSAPRQKNRQWESAFLLALALVGLSLFAGPSRLSAQAITSAAVDGEVEHIFLDDPTDFFSSGTIVVGITTIIVPRNLLIDLPANRVTLAQLFNEAPPECRSLGETGLARSDGCVYGKQAAFAHILANTLPDGTNVAGDVFLQKGNETAIGTVTFIDHTQGFMRINGDPSDATNTGLIVRINDPEGVHTIQSGLGCNGGPNCSPDPRFTNDPENYTITFTTGYPMCIPSTVATGGNRTVGSDANGLGDEFCPASNRGNLVAQDSQFFAPLQVGDAVTCEGNMEIVRDRVTGVDISFLSCHTFTVSTSIHSRNAPDQPDYVTFDEAEWDAPGYRNERVKALFIGFSTLPESEVTLFALDKDPVSGENQERLLGSTINNPNNVNQGIGVNGRNIWKIVYDVDFIKGAPVSPRLSPCTILTNAGFDPCPSGFTMEAEFAILAPLTREIIAHSRHSTLLNPGVTAHNLLGQPWQHGKYLTPVGIGHPEFEEIDLNGMATPFTFSGETWNIDRRLGPNGCDEVCDDVATAPMGTLFLDPFPYSGLDAIGQITALAPANVSRVFEYFPLDSGNILFPPGLPSTLGNVKAPAITPACTTLNSAPIAVDDVVTTPVNTAIVLVSGDLTGNDLDLDGDFLTIENVPTTTAQGGTVVAGGGGSWTYTPATGFIGIDVFNYGVADSHGGTASGNVFITVTAP